MHAEMSVSALLAAKQDTLKYSTALHLNGAGNQDVYRPVRLWLALLADHRAALDALQLRVQCE